MHYDSWESNETWKYRQQSLRMYPAQEAVGNKAKSLLNNDNRMIRLRLTMLARVVRRVGVLNRLQPPIRKHLSQHSSGRARDHIPISSTSLPWPSEPFTLRTDAPWESTGTWHLCHVRPVNKQSFVERMRTRTLKSNSFPFHHHPSSAFASSASAIPCTSLSRPLPVLKHSLLFPL